VSFFRVEVEGTGKSPGRVSITQNNQLVVELGVKAALNMKL
jgi:hypothetical protein